MTFTFPEMREAPGAQDAHELHHHVIWVSIACIGKFLVCSGRTVGTQNLQINSYISYLNTVKKRMHSVTWASALALSTSARPSSLAPWTDKEVKCKLVPLCKASGKPKTYAFFVRHYKRQLGRWLNRSMCNREHKPDYQTATCEWAWKLHTVWVLMMMTDITCTRETRIRQKWPDVSDWMASSKDFL